MPIFSVTINARDSKDGVPDIKYVRKLQAKSMMEATSKVSAELELAVPKSEVIDIEARRLTD